MLQSLRYALRQLRNSPGFAATAILTLALGIGATTAIFSILDAVLLQPLPFPHPDRLVALSSRPWGGVSIPTVQDWKTRSHSFQSITAYKGAVPTVRSTRGSEAGQVIEVTQNFLTTLGIPLALGHDFARTGNEHDCYSEVIVSGAFWNRLGGGSSLGNRTLEIDRHTYQITGVLPLGQEMEGPNALNHPEVLLPIGCDPFSDPAERGWSSYDAIGRLLPRVTLAQAALDLDLVQQSLRHDYPGYYPPYFHVVALPFADLVAGTGTRAALFTTLAACGLLLLIACANLANLLLARNTRRRHEFATRATLGASLCQLLNQLLIESAVLAALGALAGLALAEAAIRSVKQVSVLHMPRIGHAALHPRVLIFAILVSAAVTILLTLLPALRTLRPSLLADLTQSGRGASSSSSLQHAGRVLVTAQIALALVLVSWAGWMISSIRILLHQPLGFAPDHLLLAGVDIHGSSVTPAYDGPRTALFFTQAIEAIRRLPGVQAVAAANHPPISGSIDRTGFCSDAHPDQCHRYNEHGPDNFHVTPGYFAAIGQTFYGGRDFIADDSTSNHVVIVNRALAAQEWPGQDPVGKRIWSGDIQAWATVIGVVGNVHNFDLTSPPVPNLYFPETDHPKTAMTIVLRTAGDPALLSETVRRTLTRQHPDLALFRLQPMETRMAHEVAQRSFLMQVAAAFGALALFLAILGTYGLLAYEVSLREKEIGIRLALGSSREAIVQLLLGQESRWVLLGAATGLFAAILTGYGLRAQFYHAGAASLPVLAASLLLLLLPSLAAIALPARRAAHLDPVQTLRNE
ncbi:MAG TPA: ADOP family duplicated permease [Acidobacteriaceae bacterium]|nr:ADOP family duplicated permease [Acidobacteriaceae bacterium]